MIYKIKHITNLFLISLLALNFQVVTVFAQNEKFTASSSATTVSVNDQFQVTFTFTGNGKSFRAPDFANFQVLMGPNQSSSVQIVNGNFSQTLSFTYVLQAESEGTFKIGAAEITGSSGKVLSNTLSINVVKGSAQAQSGKQSGSDQNNPDSRNVFLRTSVDKTNVYLGEAVVVTYRLYTKVTLLNYSIEKIPAMNGFWSQDIPMPQQLQFRQESVDGVAYNVADLKKTVLFPQRSGTLTVDAMTGEVIARLQVKRQGRSNDPFDQFFNDPFFNNPFNSGVKDVKIPLKGDPIKINVRDLPDNAPVSFGGAVGKLNYEVSVDKKEVKAHDPVTLKIKISGKGNIKLIDPPAISFPPDFETYDPKENSNLNATAGGVTGTKTFEYLLIPRNPGEYKIPIADFSYFDLDKKVYQEIKSPEIIIKVDKGDESMTVVTGSGVNKSDIQLLGKDIRFIKTNDPDFKQDSLPLYGSPEFYSLLTAPALLFGGMLLVRKRQEKRKGKTGILKSRRANKVALKRLALAKKLLASNEKEKFLDEISKAMWGFISDKLQIPVSDLSKESATEALLKINIKPELITEFTDTIDKCEFSRFAGSQAESHLDLYRLALNSISKIEESARS
jgi:hypothetical protein